MVRVRPAHLVEHLLPHWPPFLEMPKKRSFSRSSARCSTRWAGRTPPCSITLWWLVRVRRAPPRSRAQLDLRFLDSNSLSSNRWIETMPRRGYRFIGPPVADHRGTTGVLFALTREGR